MTDMTDLRHLHRHYRIFVRGAINGYRPTTEKGRRMTRNAIARGWVYDIGDGTVFATEAGKAMLNWSITN